MGKIIKTILLIFIKVYQFAISPFFPATCRFTPSCSVYANDALEKYGVLKGGGLAIKRIFSCHPFGRSGYDPVP